MTSLKQIEANRLNALKSADPRIQTGKQTLRGMLSAMGDRRNVEPLEDPEDYKAFQEAV